MTLSLLLSYLLQENNQTIKFPGMLHHILNLCSFFRKFSIIHGHIHVRYDHLSSGATSNTVSHNQKFSHVQNGIEIKF